MNEKNVWEAAKRGANILFEGCLLTGKVTWWGSHHVGFTPDNMNCPADLTRFGMKHGLESMLSKGSIGAITPHKAADDGREKRGPDIVRRLSAVPSPDGIDPKSTR